MNLNVILPSFLLFLSVMFLSACEPDIDSNMSQSMIDFSFTNQDEEILSMDDLKGEWWIAYMSYTDCTTVCPRTTANMVGVQNDLKEDNLHPQIVSFSVDPDNDQPEVLRNYAEEQGVDLNSWDFLTGYDFETIQLLSEEVFQASLVEGSADQKSHSYMFYLINAKGKVVKKYDGMGEKDIEQLVDDVKSVLQ